MIIMHKRQRFIILVGVVEAFIVLFRKKREYKDSKKFESPCDGHDNLSCKRVNTIAKLHVK